MANWMFKITSTHVDGVVSAGDHWLLVHNVVSVTEVSGAAVIEYDTNGNGMKGSGEFKRYTCSVDADALMALINTTDVAP